MRYPVVLQFIAAVALVAGCRGRPANMPGDHGPARVSNAASRTAVSLTVYTDGFGLIREQRQVNLPAGVSVLHFRDVARSLDPKTLRIEGLSKTDAIVVQEQNYRYDALTPAQLLEKYIGRTVSVYEYDKPRAREVKKVATVLASSNGPVLKIDGQIVSAPRGRLAFPEVPPNLVARPTLVWLLESREPQRSLDVSYLAQNLGWHADYVLNIDPKAATAEIKGWVTLENRTGADFRQATLRLVAGDVHRILPPTRTKMSPHYGVTGGAANAFREQSLFEYHQYTLARPVDIADQEQKQLSLLEAGGIRFERYLIFKDEVPIFKEKFGELAKINRADTYIKFVNSAANQLGVPLPKGVIRVYQSDEMGSAQFVGEDSLIHTPRDEQVRVRVGRSSGVFLERVQTEWRSAGPCSSETAWELSLRNHRDERVQVEIEEPMVGQWDILNASHPTRRKSAEVLLFNLDLFPRVEQKIHYRVRVRWC